MTCPSATDCKITYRDNTNTSLKFADCDDATCSSGTVDQLDGARLFMSTLQGLNLIGRVTETQEVPRGIVDGALAVLETA